MNYDIYNQTNIIYNTYNISLTKIYDLYDVEEDVLSPTDTMTLIYEDNFESINTDIWDFRTGKYRTKIYLPEDYSQNAYSDNGLVFQALKNNPTLEQEWSSVFMQTHEKFTIQYGAIESKIAFSEADHLHATLWTLAENGRGEIDIAEYDTGTGVACTCHFYNQDGSKGKSHPLGHLQVNPQEENTYLITWDENYIKLYCNNIYYGRFKLDEATLDGYNSFRQPHYLIYNTLPFSVTGEQQESTYSTVSNKAKYLKVYSLLEE